MTLRLCLPHGRSGPSAGRGGDPESPVSTDIIGDLLP